MKLTWKKDKTSKKRSLAQYPNLPFDRSDDESNKKDDEDEDTHNQQQRQQRQSSDAKQLAESFQEQGNQLAENGKYREALAKWEAALNLMPDSAVIHEQKAQILLEIGDSWNALKAALCATELEPSWAEAWITLGRAQLNFGEPDSAMESFDKALAIKPDSAEAQDDRRTASQLLKRRKQLHLSGLSTSTNRFIVGDQAEISEGHKEDE